MAQDDYAVVVGISLYPGFNDLQGPVNDAEAFCAWLTDPQKGAVDPARVSCCVTSRFHPPVPADASQAHPVEDEVNQLFKPFMAPAARGTRVGRRIYIYMAGHGFSDPADMKTAALYAANAEPLFAPHVTATEYAEFFRRSTSFDEIVLIMDCCRVASPLLSVRRPPVPNIAVRPRAADVRTFYAFGAGWAQVSREKVINGRPQGIFTYALLQALDQASPDPQNRVTGQKVKDYIHNCIDAVAGDVRVGPPEIEVDSARDITFVTRQVAPAAQVTLTPPAGSLGNTLRVHDSQSEVFSARIDGPTVTVALGPGFYKARIAAIQFEKLFEVTGDKAEIAL